MSAKIKKTSAGFSENMDLKASDDKFKFMFEHSIVGKSFTLPSGEIHVNRAFCEILGYSQAELQNKKWQDISHSDDIEMNQKVVEKILAGEQDSARFTKRYLHKNGNVVWADVNLSLRRDETGQPLYFMTEISDITARKQTEEALRESEERYKLMFESAPLAINITSGTEITYANPSYLKLFGFSNLGELKNIPPLELFTPEARTQILENIQRRAQGLPVPNIYEAECFRKDRTTFTVLMHLTRTTFADGPATVAFIIDITERKRTEQALRESESTARALLDLPLTASFLINAQGTILDLNETMALRFGQTAAEIKGCNVYNLLPPEIASRRKAIVEEVIASGQMQRYEDERQGIWNDHMVNPILDEQGKVIKIVIAAHDITERKQAEATLRKSEAKFRAIIENSNDGILFGDAQANILYRSPSYEQINGYTEAERVGHNGFETVHPDEAASLRRYWAKVIEHPEISPKTEYRIQHKDGSWRWIETRCRNLLHKPEVQAIVVTSRDITEQKRAEEQLRKSEKDYRTLVENIQMGLVVHAPDTSILYSNPRASELLGLTPDQMRGKAVIDPAWHFIQKDGSRMPLDQYPVNQALSAETPITDLVLGILRPDREDPTWVQCNAHQNMDLDGKLQQVVVTFLDITERKRAEAALRENELKYRSLFETASDAILLFTDGQWVDCNAGALKIFGCTREQIIGTHPNRFSPPTQPDGRSSEVEASQKIKLAFAGKPQSFEWEHCHADGTLFAAEVHLNRLDLEGKPYIQAIVRDVTERKQAEAALRESELHYKQLFNAIPESILLIGTDRCVLAANQASASLYGYESPQQLEGLDTRLLIAEKDRDHASKTQTSVLQGEEISTREYTEVRRDGSEFIAEVNSTTLHGPQQDVIGYIGITRDITKRKQTEAKLKESELTSRRMSQQLAVVNQMSAEIASGLDFEQLIERLYQQCQRIGDTDSFYLAFYDDETDTLSFPFFFKDGERRSIESRQLGNNSGLSGQIIKNRQVIYIPDTFDLPPEVTIVRQPGIPTRSIIGVPLFLNERIVGVLSMQSHKTDAYRADQVFMLELLSKQVVVAIHNSRLYQQAQQEITARKQAEEKIRAMNLELEQRVEERTRDLREAQEQLVQQERLSVLGRLASGVAHELRNPLGVISNAVYFLKLILPDANEKVREYLNILADESQTASKFAADLLNYSNIQSGDRYPVAVLELVDLTLTHHPAPTGVTVQLDIPEDLPPAYVDTRQIVQVLDNLVLNAYQAMLSPTGMISDGKLIISARKINNMLAIAIRDTGEGIQPENFTRIFEPLFSSKPRGIGLGLPISQKLAEVNGGKIEVESEPGKGSTFIVNLPIKTEEQA